MFDLVCFISYVFFVCFFYMFVFVCFFCMFLLHMFFFQFYMFYSHAITVNTTTGQLASHPAMCRLNMCILLCAAGLEPEGTRGRRGTQGAGREDIGGGHQDAKGDAGGRMQGRKDDVGTPRAGHNGQDARAQRMGQ
jgi:hypothetical protein